MYRIRMRGVYRIRNVSTRRKCQGCGRSRGEEEDQEREKGDDDEGDEVRKRGRKKERRRRYRSERMERKGDKGEEEEDGDGEMKEDLSWLGSSSLSLLCARATRIFCIKLEPVLDCFLISTDIYMYLNSSQSCYK